MSHQKTLLPILKPHLHYPHIQPRVLAQLLPHMSRRLRTVIVRHLQRVQLLGRDCRPGPLVRLIPIYRTVDVQALRLGRLVVGLAEQLPVLHQIELVARVELPGAHDAGETLHVVDVAVDPPHDLRGRNAEITRGTLWTVTPL